MRCKQVRQRLSRKQRELFIARAGKTYHDTVADQLVVSYAFDGGEILESRAFRAGEPGGQHKSDQLFHDVLKGKQSEQYAIEECSAA